MTLLDKIRVILLHKVLKGGRVLLGWLDDVENVFVKLNVELWETGPREGFLCLHMC